MNTALPLHHRFHGLAQIARFNWPFYLMASAAIATAMTVIAAADLPHWLTVPLICASSLAGYWMIASLVVSHWVYDRSPLSKWTWLVEALGKSPARWVNIHCGLDESSPALRRIFPHSRGRVLDIFAADEMTEPSIRRAREGAQNEIAPEPADYRHLPIADASFDAAMLLLSAHELRRHESRVALLRELHRSLHPASGRVVVAEHLRDVANFLAFGPGFLHFHSRSAWRAAASEAGFVIEREFRITPFVAVFILRRSS